MAAWGRSVATLPKQPGVLLPFAQCSPFTTRNKGVSGVKVNRIAHIALAARLFMDLLTASGRSICDLLTLNPPSFVALRFDSSSSRYALCGVSSVISRR